MKPCLLREQGDWNVVLKLKKGQEDDRNDKSQPNHSYVNLPQIKWDFLVYLIIFVRSSSKRPLEE